MKHKTRLANVMGFVLLVAGLALVAGWLYSCM
jgi:hypothetical protein